MSNLTVKGTQEFMGKVIPVVLGGFGEGKKCISDKTIAEVHDIPAIKVRERIQDNIRRFTEGVDFIDLAQRIRQTDTLSLLHSLGYASQSISQAKHIYLLSERGYAKLIKIMDTDLAWQIHDRLVDEYFALREQAKQTMLDNGVSPSLQAIKVMIDNMIAVELEQKKQAKIQEIQAKAQAEQEKRLETVNKRVDDIREVVAVTPTKDTWREECRRLVVKIAQAKGGGDAYKEVNHKIFELVNKRAGVSLDTRLTNRRRRMAEEGISKTARDKINKIDVIAEDKKLIEVYTAIIKELAVKCGVA